MDIYKTLHQPNKVCPSCGVDNKCALEEGKSISACWCFGEEIYVDIKEGPCYCRRCLTKGENKDV